MPSFASGNLKLACALWFKAKRLRERAASERLSWNMSKQIWLKASEEKKLREGLSYLRGWVKFARWRIDNRSCNKEFTCMFTAQSNIIMCVNGKQCDPICTLEVASFFYILGNHSKGWKERQDHSVCHASICVRSIRACAKGMSRENSLPPMK